MKILKRKWRQTGYNGEAKEMADKKMNAVSYLSYSRACSRMGKGRHNPKSKTLRTHRTGR